MLLGGRKAIPTQEPFVAQRQLFFFGCRIFVLLQHLRQFRGLCCGFAQIAQSAADAATRDPRGIYAHYRALIQLRKTQRVIQDGDYSPLLAEHPQIFAYRRENSEATLVVLANFYGEGAKAPLADTAGYQLLLGNYADSPALLAEEVLLRPYEALIYLRKK